MRALLVLALTGVLALGCNDKKADPPAPGAAPPVTQAAAPATVAADPAPATATAAPADTAVAAADVPAEEDFEDKAASAITPANAEAELAKLEKEVE